MSRRRKQGWSSALLNNITFNYWYDTLMSLAINRFEWKGLPETCDPRFLELNLFERGYCLFFEDDILQQFLTLPCSISGKWDIYNIPINRRAYASNGYHCDRTTEDSVIIWNNYLHHPYVDMTRLYALKLYEIERSIDVNVKQQKFPTLIKSTEAQRLVMKNLMEQYEGNEPFIFGDESLDVTGISAINTNAPFVGLNLYELKAKVIGEFLTYMGIENNSNEKKERMVTDEVGSNYGSIEAYRNIGLNSRQQACDEINTMFGLNVSVHYRSDLPTLVNGFGTGTRIDNRRELQPWEEGVIEDE